jgi:hypothetical protein
MIVTRAYEDTWRLACLYVYLSVCLCILININRREHEHVSECSG